MKILNCVISYNRSHYLKNMIDSIKEFFPYGKTIIVDDQSNNIHTQNYLNDLKIREYVVLNTKIDKTNNLFKGGLYHAMDIGMQYAMDHNYDYINYLQDDMQCMWYDKDFENTVEKIFRSSENVLSICSEFYKKITSYRQRNQISIFQDIGAYDRKPLAAPAVSIISIERFKKLKFKFGDYDSEFSYNTPLSNLGYYCLTPKAPHFAWIPWPKTTTFGVTKGVEKPPVKKYYFKPIVGKKLDKFLNRDLIKIPYIEDYCQTWGYLSLKPYWFTQFSLQYFKMIKRNFYSKIFLFPHF